MSKYHLKVKGDGKLTYHLGADYFEDPDGTFVSQPEKLTEFRRPLQVQSHLEMPRILVQLGHTQHTWKLAPQTDPKGSPTWSLTRFQLYVR